MSNLNEKYQELVSCLEKNIQDAQELNNAKKVLAELIICYSDAINKTAENEKRLDRIENNFNRLYDRIESIEDDIYLASDEDEDELGIDQMHDNDFEFEIVCPYCHNEFITDSSQKNISQIRCPKCKKLIELDWDDSEDCGGHCHSCGGHCYEDEEATTEMTNENDEPYSINVQEPEKEEKSKEEKKKKNDNEDDM